MPSAGEPESTVKVYEKRKPAHTESQHRRGTSQTASMLSDVPPDRALGLPVT